MSTVQDTTTSDLERYALNIANTSFDWFDPATGHCSDPYRQHDTEQYTPGNLAALHAQVFRWTNDPRHLEASAVLMDRSAAIVNDPTEYRLRRWFVQYYASLAFGLLRQSAPDERVEHWRRRLAGSDIPEPNKVNIAALAIGSEFFAEAFGVRSMDLESVDRWLSVVESRQTPAGFVNDHISQDGMPVAYHMFTASTLAAANAAMRSAGLRQDLVDRVDQIVLPAIEWLTHFLDRDGFPAMAERSQDQLFTWGSWQICLAYRSVDDPDGIGRAANQRWLSVLRDDGTTATAPNHFSPAARVGFEKYSTHSVYNSLNAAQSGIVVDLLRENGLQGVESEPVLRPSEGLFVDEDAGYACWRTAHGMAAISLRMHAYRYSPAMCLYHLEFHGLSRAVLARPRLDAVGDLPRSAKGDWAESDGNGPVPYWWIDNDGGPIEGLVVDTDTHRLVSSWTSTSSCALDPQGRLVLSGGRSEFHVTRRLTWTENGLEVDNTVRTTDDAVSVSALLPLVSDTGKDHMTWRETSSGFEHSLAGELVEFDLGGASWGMSTRSSLSSPSGTSAQVAVHASTDDAGWHVSVRISPERSS